MVSLTQPHPKMGYSSRQPNELPLFVRFWGFAEWGVYSRMGSVRRVFVTQLEVLVTWEFYRGVGTNLVVGNW